MKYYKNPVNNSIHAFESDGSQDSIIDSSYIAITDTEADDILNPLNLVKNQQVGLLDFGYNLAISKDVVYTTEAKITEIFQANLNSRTNVQSMLAALTTTTMPKDFYWIASDNLKITFTYNDLQGLALVMGNQGWFYFNKLQIYKLQVSNAKTKEEVKAIVWVD